MTEDQRAMILESLAAGCSLPDARRGAGVTREAFAAACAADREYERACDAAMAAARREREAQASANAAALVPARVAPSVACAAVAVDAVVGVEPERAEKASEHAPQRAPAATAAQGRDAWAEASPLDGIAAEAARFAPGPFGFFLWLESRLVKAGFPPVSPWWLATLRAFYESNKRWLVVMAGRGAGKSTLLTRVAVAEALFTKRTSPPGEAWIWPFVSASTGDARKRIRQIAAILNALGMRNEKGKPIEPSYPQNHPTIETFDASGNPIEFVAYASTIASLSGPTSIGATIDEEAKLRGENSANPSGEVIITLAATFRARPGIRAIRCSSAWLTEGSHYGAVSEGDTIVNMVAPIGDEFMPDVLSGLESVARWEEKFGNKGVGDPEAAKKTRAHAIMLQSASAPRWVRCAAPTWLGNPTLGNPAGAIPWNGAAVASRVEMETLDQKTFDALFPGMSRAAAWLRECASVPVPADDNNYAEQCIMAADITARVVRAGGPRHVMPQGPMRLPGMPPGDPRYAGPTSRGKREPGGWRTRKVF